MISIAIEISKTASEKSDAKSAWLYLGRTTCGDCHHRDSLAAFRSGWLEPTDKDGRHAWGANILPYIEQENLYDNIGDMLNNVSSDTSKNGAILTAYLCPSSNLEERSPDGMGRSNYVGNEGSNNNNWDNGGVLYQNSEITFADIFDGTSNTFLVGEADGSVNPAEKAFPVWAGSPDVGDAFGQRSVVRGATLTNTINRYATAAGFLETFHPAVYSSRHPGGANFVFCDASVHFIPETIATGTSTTNPNGPWVQLAVRYDGMVLGEY